jgi:hypothetical protein
LRRVVVAHLALLLLPLAALTFSVLWAPNCAYPTGLAFFALFAIPSVILGAAVGYVIRATGVRAPRALFVFVSVVILVAGLIYDLGLHPQFYTYNHVFGGVLGPIYDEDLTIRSGLVWFRLLSILWALGLVAITVSMRARRIGRAVPADSDRKAHTKHQVSRARVRVQRGVVLSSIGIGLVYAFSAPLGINSPEWYIRQWLGAHSSSERFDLYHTPELAEARVDALLSMYEYHFDRLHGVLGVMPNERVAVYAYPDPFTRERLTGARYTNVAPVWLPSPQIHVLHDVPERVHAHELVHVFSREFGLPVLNASIAVGLIEGLAVALERPHAGPSPDDQVLAMLDDPRFDVSAVAERMTPTGFWGGRGAVSYTTAGSFVSFLLSAYPVSSFTSAYSTGRFGRYYGRSVEDLAAEWEASLRRRPVVSAFAARTAVQRFSIPSLFEVRCPHYTPPHRRHFQSAQRALIQGDTARAMIAATQSLTVHGAFAPAGMLLAELQLLRDQPEEAVRTLNALSMTPQRDMRLGDAHALRGDVTLAREAYVRLLSTWPVAALDQRALTIIRYHVARDADAIRALYSRKSGEIEFQAATAEAMIHAGLIAIRANRFEEAIGILTAPELTGPLNGLDESGWLVERLRLRLLITASIDAGRGDLTMQAARRGREMATVLGDIDSASSFEHSFERGLWLARRTTP